MKLRRIKRKVFCQVKSCSEAVFFAGIMCKAHWQMVPHWIKKEIIEGFYREGVEKAKGAAIAAVNRRKDK